ncbi:hypothetical protein SAMN05444004_101408 [Jannaschia faecimaris]|uniref:Integrase core domain-containing protein n=1 Tax=Jannaschia faecimaris TaxID=1244108 RepID=A0A1H3JSD8_9RHOB|nr:hypothetical protein SAMN05444004_101408 [Jannaschia faecimaris]
MGQIRHGSILLENYFLPGNLEASIERFVDGYNHHGYHESLGNLTPADVYFEHGKSIALELERIMQKTIKQRCLQHRKRAAYTNPTNEPIPPLNHAATSPKYPDDGQPLQIVTERQSTHDQLSAPCCLQSR